MCCAVALRPQMCLLISTSNGHVFRPKECERLILYLKDINLPKPDKWGTAQLISFLQQVLSYGGFYDQNLEFLSALLSSPLLCSAPLCSLLFCSDGVWKVITDHLILASLAHSNHRPCVKTSVWGRRKPSPQPHIYLLAVISLFPPKMCCAYKFLGDTGPFLPVGPL